MENITSEKEVKLNGSCHCGNIHVAVELSRAPETYNPRACDCDFCKKHGASYLSDPAGSLSIHIKDDLLLGKYRQGSGTADCLFCKKCGVLVGVAYQENRQLFATVNSMVIDGGIHFGEHKAVSPKMLSASEKSARWKDLWFANVYINADA